MQTAHYRLLIIMAINLDTHVGWVGMGQVALGSVGREELQAESKKVPMRIKDPETHAGTYTAIK
jgi:hypothetical protein